MFSLHFNYDLFFLGMVIWLFIASVLGIICGLAGTKKSQSYSIGDAIFYGILFLFLIICAIS